MVMSGLRYRLYPIFGFHEILAVSHRLDEQKDRVEHQRRQRHEDSLQNRKRRSTGGSGEARKHQTEHGERHDDVKIRVDPLQIVMLLAMAEPAHQQTEPDEAVESNHDNSKD